MKVIKAGYIAFPAADMEASVHFNRDLLELPELHQCEDEWLLLQTPMETF